MSARPLDGSTVSRLGLGVTSGGLGVIPLVIPLIVISACGRTHAWPRFITSETDGICTVYTRPQISRTFLRCIRLDLPLDQEATFPGYHDATVTHMRWIRFVSHPPGIGIICMILSQASRQTAVVHLSPQQTSQKTRGLLLHHTARIIVCQDMIM